ncbi:DUF6452 family protein [Maribacter sp. 2304DJ31-5]|uniref:DUF6452 family protein n=1 Tax=Maribacter sp. 2304DJ31-5 TaxID=3386273 RepID=UPI0039BD6359
MPKIRLIIIFFLAIVAVSSCEKDDICVDANTPLLVIEFFDNANSTDTKNVNSLRVVGLGQTVTVNTVMDRTNLNTISIPLKTTEDITSFLLIRDSDSDENGVETGNIDTINISYDRLEDFKSRACGFIVNYENLSASLQTTDTDSWIQDITVVQSQVINSDSTHVKIFH